MLREHLDAFPLVLWTAHPDGRPEHFGRPWAELTGQEPPPGAGSPADWLDPFHAEDRARLAAAWSAALSAGVPLEARGRLRDRATGQYRCCLLRAHPDRDDAGVIRRWCGCLVEIEAQARAERALAEEEARLRGILQNDVIGILFFGLDSTLAEPNRTLLRMLRMPDAEDATVDWAAFTPFEYRQRDLKALQELRDHGSCEHYEKEILRVDGERIWVLVGASMLDEKRGVGFLLDITQRKQAEEALVASAGQLRLALDAGELGTWDHDPMHGRIYMDRRCRQLYAVRGQSGLSGAQFMARVHPDDRPLVRTAVQRALDPAAGGDYEVEHRVALPRGGHRWLAARGQALFVGEGAARRAVRFIGTVVDVTARRENEERLRESERRLRELTETLEARVAERTATAERRAAQLRLLATELSAAEQRERRRLAGVLHDRLQQILVAAKMGAEQLASRLQGNELAAGQRVCDLIQESIESSRNLMLDLDLPLLYERGLPAALQWLGRHFGQKHGLQVRVEVPDEPDSPDEDLNAFLFQSARELLFNVVKHAGTSEAMLGLARQGDWLHLTVADDGGGGDPALMLDSGDEEMGFGLFKIQQRVEVLGGRFAVESEPGKGCQISIGVPSERMPEAGIATAAAAPAGNGTPAVREPRRRLVPALALRRAPGAGPAVFRVLVVDDHKVVREGLTSLLGGEQDIEVVGEAENGATALALAHRLRPDVVVMDVSMPVMDGVEATRRIVTELPGTAVIGLSMHARQDLGREMIDSGAIAYLTKGGPVDELIAVIRGLRSEGAAAGRARGKGQLGGGRSLS